MKFTNKSAIAFLSLGLLFTSVKPMSWIPLFSSAEKKSESTVDQKIAFDYAYASDDYKKAVEIYEKNLLEEQKNDVYTKNNYEFAKSKVAPVQQPVVIQPVLSDDSTNQLSDSNKTSTLFNTASVKNSDVTVGFEEPTVSRFGTKSKVALGVLGTAAVVYGSYKAIQNREAIKNGVITGLTFTKDGIVAGYNGCTIDNAKALPGLAKDVVVYGYNGLSLANAKTYSGYNWIKGLFSKPVVMSEEEIGAAVKSIMDPLIGLVNPTK